MVTTVERFSGSPIEGPDDLSASVFPLLPVFLLGLLALAFAGHLRVGFVPFTASLIAFHAIDARTRRFSISIEHDMIILRSLALGWIPVRKLKLSLECELYFVQTRDEWGWPGLHFCLPLHAIPQPQPDRYIAPYPIFGSVRDLHHTRALFERFLQRIEAARRERAALDVNRHLDPTLGELAQWWPVIDPVTVMRNAWGRVASARTTGPAEHGSLGGIPGGSTLRFCQDDRFRVRATPDVVTSVEFSAPSDELHVLADLDPPAVPSRPGARVTLMTLGTRKRPVTLLRFENAFDAVTFDGRPVRGTAPIEASNGVLVLCTLEDPLTVLGIALPAGCEVSTNTQEFIVTSPAEYTWRGCAIAPPVRVHFGLTPDGKTRSLRDILRDPDRYLRPAAYSNPYAHTAPVSAGSATNMGASEFIAKISEPGVVIVDVSFPEEFAAGHLQGAVNLDVSSSNPNPNFETQIAELDMSGSYAIYCRNGNMSTIASPLDL